MLKHKLINHFDEIQTLIRYITKQIEKILWSKIGLLTVIDTDNVNLPWQFWRSLKHCHTFTNSIMVILRKLIFFINFYLLYIFRNQPQLFIGVLKIIEKPATSLINNFNDTHRKKHRQMKLQRLQKAQIWAFGLLV